MQPLITKPKIQPNVHDEVKTIAGWPTDTVSIDHHPHQHQHQHHPTPEEPPRTLLLFVPGNPGCVGWYVTFLRDTLSRLGRGYAVRGVSYAGHGVGSDIVGYYDDDDENSTSATTTSCEDTPKRRKKRNTHVAWTVEGQVRHKIEWIDGLLEKKTTQPPPNLIFVSHSIGSHLIQRLLILRPDILHRTKLLLHLMPFVRFDPPTRSKRLSLSLAARLPSVSTALVTTASGVASLLPETFVEGVLKTRAKVDCEEGRELARRLVRQPIMARNFITLGIDEIRRMPRDRHDDAAMRVVGRRCPTRMLYCGGPDTWAPRCHVDDIVALQREGLLPKNIVTEYAEELVHDFVVHPEMVPRVIDFCVRGISEQEGVEDDDGEATDNFLVSRL